MITGRQGTDVLEIKHDGKRYSSAAFIPVNLGSFSTNRSKFTMTFLCTSKCQRIRDLQLGTGFFLRNRPKDGEEAYDVHQGNCDKFFNMKIK